MKRKEKRVTTTETRIEVIHVKLKGTITIGKIARIIEEIRKRVPVEIY